MEQIKMDESTVLKLLGELDIPYLYISHPEVKTVADHASFVAEFPAQLLKNLLLKNSAAKNFYLYILDGNKKADLKELAAQLEESRLSFASPDELMATLGVEPGGVTPFGIMHNNKSDIQIVIDLSVSNEQPLGFHPLVNTASVCISKSDLLRLLAFYGYFPTDLQTNGMIRLLA
ncbi:YbaK/EbsC family protein [Buttiauxella gaviniae]|uniref:YbaK/EbsC family protein n=1 Tax=Buttiauxella gaviniae TaxID=82990 RepID=UPI003BB6A607